MENKPKKPFGESNFHYARFNSTKIKPNYNNINSNDANVKKKDNLSNIKNDNSYNRSKPNEINKNNNNKFEFAFNKNEINNEEKNNIINDDIINKDQEEIKKLKLENELLKHYLDKKNKLIIELEDKCNEQNEEMNIIIDKIKNIKKFIPENALKKDKRKQIEKDKLEEQLAIAAVDEQIMMDLCPDNTNKTTMDKIFNDNNNVQSNKIKDKILNIPQIYYKKNQFDNYECFICIDEFKENELLKQLKCGHIFHKECLSQWLLNQNNCPVCNKIC